MTPTTTPPPMEVLPPGIFHIGVIIGGLAMVTGVILYTVAFVRAEYPDQNIATQHIALLIFLMGLGTIATTLLTLVLL